MLYNLKKNLRLTNEKTEDFTATLFLSIINKVSTHKSSIFSTEM